MDYNIFVLEDLSGIRKQKSKGKILNKWLSNWSFFQLEQLIKYKAEALGKQVFKVDPRYTSQKCSNCSVIEKSNRNKAKYNCNKCGYTEHSDVNAAKNIRNNHIFTVVEKQKVKQAVVNQPNVTFEVKIVTSHQPSADGN